MRRASYLTYPMAFGGLFFISMTSAVERESVDQQPVSSLDMVTVVATKAPRSTFEVPGMATVVDTQAPAIAGSSRVKNLLRDVPGVEFNGSARRNGQNIFMRGYDTEGLLILFDGVRQKFEAGHDGKFFIDPALLKRVEVIRGPNSTLYGSGGLGGVIAFETMEASDLLGTGENRGVKASTGYQSVNDEWMVSLSGYARNEQFDVLASALSRNSGNIKLGDGQDLKSDDGVISGLFKAGWNINPFNTLKLNFQGYRNDAEEPNNPQSATSQVFYGKETSSYRTSLSYAYDNPDNNLLSFKARLYYNDTEVKEQKINDQRVVSRQLDTTGFSLENQSRFSVGANVSNTVTYGAEIYTERQHGADNTGPGGEAGGIPDAETDYWGIFLQDEITINSLAGRFLIIPGIRFDNYQSKNTTGSSTDRSEVSPKLGLTYRPRDWLMVFASYAHAFRAPTMTEMFASGTHFRIPGLGSNVFVPNPDLKPETNRTLEFGFGMQFDDLFTSNDRLQFKMSHFDTDAEDFIDSEVDFTFFPVCCGTTRTVNVPRAEIRGYEFEGGYENKHVRIALSYADVDGKNENNGEYLTTVTPPTVTANIGLKLPHYGSILGWRSVIAGTHDEVNQSSAIRESYDVHDLYYQWVPQGIDKLTVNVGIDNIFDAAYERVFAGSLEPGRNYRLQVSYRW